jgi:hypothetical protein
MFKVDKEDGLFTLNSVFLVFRDKKLLYFLTFRDLSDTSKTFDVWYINDFGRVDYSLITDFEIPWKKGNDSLSAKHVSRVITQIEKYGFDIWFWPETIKNQSIKDFYLQKVKPKLKLTY